MKKNLVALAAILMIGLSACAQKNISYIRMQRSACFGRCPVYWVEVYKNGLVRYSGQRFTEHQGVYEKNIGTANTAALFKLFGSYHVDTCKRNYEVLISDLPGIYYKIMMGKKTKRIDNAHFGPSFLKELSKSVDSLAIVDGSWKKVADTAMMSSLK